MKRAMRLIAATLLLVVAMSLWSYVARAAAVLNLNGQKIVLMSAEELVGAMQAKDDEIAALKARLEDKVKAECNLI